MELHVGKYVIVAFHNLTNPTRIHTELKRHAIDAAVVDHAYIFSYSQLATALHRIATGAVSPGTIASHKRNTREPIARCVFVALSLTHNLDRVLQVLPAGQGTTAAVIILLEPTAEQLRVLRDAAMSVCGGVAHSLLSATDVAVPDAAAFRAYVDMHKIQTYYNISDKEVRAVRESFSQYDEGQYCLSSGVSNASERDVILAIHALEQCVVNKIATSDC